MLDIEEIERNRRDLWIGTFHQAHVSGDQPSDAIKEANSAVKGYDDFFSKTKEDTSGPKIRSPGEQTTYDNTYGYSQFNQKEGSDLYDAVAQWVVYNHLERETAKRLWQTFIENDIPTKGGQEWTVKNVQTFKSRQLSEYVDVIRHFN